MKPFPASLKAYREVWLVDFEFASVPGERPKPVCLVAREFFSGQTFRLWQDEFPTVPPYPTGRDVLFVAYFASADLSCHLALGWPTPKHILDLYAEFRCLTNGLKPPCGNGLLGALLWYGLGGGTAERAGKDSMRQLAQQGQWTAPERQSLLDYCESDVLRTERLLHRMEREIDLPRALLRGWFLRAVAQMEWDGVPIDIETLATLRRHWGQIQDRLIQSIDAQYGVYDGRHFREAEWERWLAREKIPWPRHESGRLALDDDTFKEMARAYPKVSPIRELRHALSKLRLEELAVGEDGRNRALLSPYQALTGRNAPSTNQYIFGLPAWLRSLVKPSKGRALAYIDWSQQEFGIAAALPGDAAMMEAYLSGDPYLAFAKQAGKVPSAATKMTHATERELFKACVLGVQYGMGAAALAQRVGLPTAYGRELLGLHQQTYPRFWEWSQAAVTMAMSGGSIHTVFGWTYRVTPDTNPRTLLNFPCQANGAEMLRWACCLIVERGVMINAPIHDAILIESDEQDIGEAVATAQSAMAEASAVILGGFRLRSEALIIRWPDRYIDKRGREFWGRVMRLVGGVERV